MTGYVKCTNSRKGCENYYRCGAHECFFAQVCTMGHTFTGKCICTKTDNYTNLGVNPMCLVTGHSGQLTLVAYSLDGKYIVSGSEDSSLKIWDSATGAEVGTFVGRLAAWRGVFGVCRAAHLPLHVLVF